MRQAVRWFVAFLLVFLLTGILGEVLFADADLPLWFTSTMLALNIVGAASIAFMLLATFAHQRNEALVAVRVEQEKSESLLVNVLPGSIAARLKTTDRTIADHFDETSILFADVVDFTPALSAYPRPRWSTSSIGSSPTSTRSSSGTDSRRSRPSATATWRPPGCRTHTRIMRAEPRYNVDMRTAVRPRRLAGREGLELRIGINSGPVVAGVIGRKRFIYDLWSDAVNTASRMESHGTPGEIQITRATYELLKDEFVCRPRGTIEVKGRAGWRPGTSKELGPAKRDGEPTSIQGAAACHQRAHGALPPCHGGLDHEHQHQRGEAVLA